jgi:muramidase (phage lysozyme)
MAILKVKKPLAAFLDLIAASEGTSSHPLTKADGYDVIVSGVDGHHIFADFATHPFALGRPPILVREARPEQVKTLPIGSHSKPQIVAPAVPALHSTASGRYQITLPTWHEISAAMHLGTFSPQNQDAAALKILEECHAIEDILALDIPTAIDKACDVWASFPGNLYNQGARQVSWMLAQWQTLLGAQYV